ncbi:hypothetical protein M404DRAFT_992343 [Pisolithus tinctorius Marx 270]|uniref:Uncharacterized protein n=1 Tax=Pisolithus tinctorius Marx 270 TaxID=870435 RepID=A0A0C3PY77_PISTI|nr:hypothetical protein M404DRAFT_992343 [Pisolithus tinctorius Marx 270]
MVLHTEGDVIKTCTRRNVLILADFPGSLVQLLNRQKEFQFNCSEPNPLHGYPSYTFAFLAFPPISTLFERHGIARTTWKFKTHGHC